MQSTQAHTGNFPRHSHDSPTFAAPAVKGLKGLLRWIFGLRVRVEDDIVAHYAGCGWNDAIERQIIDDITSIHSEPRS
jgi:hypothetical protein